MSQKGCKVLETLGESFREMIDFVVAGRDKNVRDDYCDEIRELCRKLEIPCFDRRERYEIKSRYAIAVSWRWLIRLDETELIVFHDSLLPKYRGFNPLVSYLINGESKIGATALYAAEEYDRGDIIAQSASEISYPIKISEAVEIVSNNYAALAARIAGAIRDGGEIKAVPQNEAEASYSLWRDEADYRIDWTLSAEEIRRFIDAVGFPYNGASTLLNGRLARVLEAEEAPEDARVENRAPGKVIFIREHVPYVVCGRGLIKIKTLIDDETGESLLPLGKMRSRFE